MGSMDPRLTCPFHLGIFSVRSSVMHVGASCARDDVRFTVNYIFNLLVAVLSFLFCSLVRVLWYPPQPLPCDRPRYLTVYVINLHLPCTEGAKAYLDNNLESSSQQFLFCQVQLGPLLRCLDGHCYSLPLASLVENNPRSGYLLF